MEGGEEVEGTREEGRSHQQWESALTTHLVVVGATNKPKNKTGAGLKAGLKAGTVKVDHRRWMERNVRKCIPSSECGCLLREETSL